MLKLIAAAVVALVATIGYCTSTETNPVTGEEQRVALTAEQEVALGVQAAGPLADQYGGLDADAAAQRQVDQVGGAVVERSIAGRTPYDYQFHLLDDGETRNAFALPGGQVFITEGLLRALESEAQLAAVLAHEVAHVIGRHGAEQLARQRLTEGLAGAATIATYDPESPGTAATGAIAAAIGQLVGMRYSREHELEADSLGVVMLREAGVDPVAMIQLLEILSREGAAPPEFFSTHPDPGNRVERIRAIIEREDA